MEQDTETKQYRKVLSYQRFFHPYSESNPVPVREIRKGYLADNRIVKITPRSNVRGAAGFIGDKLRIEGHLVEVIEFEWTSVKPKVEKPKAQPKVVKAKAKAVIQKSSAPKVKKARGAGSTLATRVVKSQAKPLTPKELEARKERLRMYYNYTR